MAELEVNVTALPQNTRDSFRDLARLLANLAADNLLGLSAFGGWLADDPLFRATPARSVAVLRRFDLHMLDRLATEGVHFGKRGLSAPLMMTPEYIDASRDVFPLELLEIQQVHALLHGQDHFAELGFARPHVRLQCERELKSELIQLRQGLLAAAGQHNRLGQLCRNGAERAMRVLRGVLHLASAEAPRLSTDLVTRAAEVAGIRLEALAQVVADASRVEFAGFEKFYGDLSALAAYVDKLEDQAAKRQGDKVTK